MTVDEKRRARRGPKPLPAGEKREHTVSVRLNLAELSWLDAERAPLQMQRGEYLRAAAMDRLPPTIPALNREAWADLARVSANLNQAMRAVNDGSASGIDPEILDALHDQLRRVRLGLLGVK